MCVCVCFLSGRSCACVRPCLLCIAVHAVSDEVITRTHFHEFPHIFLVTRNRDTTPINTGAQRLKMTRRDEANTVATSALPKANARSPLMLRRLALLHRLRLRRAGLGKPHNNVIRSARRVRGAHFFEANLRVAYAARTLTPLYSTCALQLNM